MRHQLEHHERQRETGHRHHRVRLPPFERGEHEPIVGSSLQTGGRPYQTVYRFASAPSIASVISGSGSGQASRKDRTCVPSAANAAPSQDDRRWADQGHCRAGRAEHGEQDGAQAQADAAAARRSRVSGRVAGSGTLGGAEAVGRDGLAEPGGRPAPRTARGTGPPPGGSQLVDDDLTASPGPRGGLPGSPRRRWRCSPSPRPIEPPDVRVPARRSRWRLASRRRTARRGHLGLDLEGGDRRAAWSS